MKLIDVLKDYEGHSVKIGMGTSFVFCGKFESYDEISNLSDLELATMKERLVKCKEELKNLNKIGKKEWSQKQYDRYLKSIGDDQFIEDPWDISHFENMYDNKKEKLRSKIITLAKKIGSFIPFFDCEVSEVFDSITEDNTKIIVCKRGIDGKFWDSSEYKKWKETGLTPAQIEQTKELEDRKIRAKERRMMRIDSKQYGTTVDRLGYL